jgi:hypothetical protein
MTYIVFTQPPVANQIGLHVRPGNRRLILAFAGHSEIAHVFPDLSPFVEIELNGDGLSFLVRDEVHSFHLSSRS